MSELVLASGSPRRKEILENAGFDFELLITDTDEQVDEKLPPGELAMALALKKARAGVEHSDRGKVVIGADTIVVLDKEILGKPRDAQEAQEMLKSLSGRWHTVFTGLALLKEREEITACEQTEVKFRRLADSEIAAYVKTGSPLDKAGAYGIQDKGALFIEGIDGDYYNVMGLPLCRLAQLLKENYGITVL